MESVQKQTVIYLRKDYLNREENGYVLSPYIDRCNELELTTLIRRRINSTALFLHKILSGRYVSPVIRQRLDLNPGIRTLRNPEFIKLKHYKNEYGLNSPFNRMCRVFNHASLFIEPSMSFNDFRARLLRLADSAFGDLAKL